MKRNTQLIESLLQLRIDLLRTVLRLFRSCIIYNILEIDFGNIKMRPLRKFHLLPTAERLKSELEHPLRFLLLRRNHSYNILIEALRNELLLDIRHKAVLIFLVRNAV